MLLRFQVENLRQRKDDLFPTVSDGQRLPLRLDLCQGFLQILGGLSADFAFQHIAECVDLIPLRGVFNIIGNKDDNSILPLTPDSSCDVNAIVSLALEVNVQKGNVTAGENRIRNALHFYICEDFCLCAQLVQHGSNLNTKSV